MLKSWLIIALAGVGLFVGLKMGMQSSSMVPAPKAHLDVAAKSLPDFFWDNLEGEKMQLTHWQGKVLVVNHWATWCAPCREEIPMFMALRQRLAEKGVEVIGIAHDNEQDVRRYVDSMGMDYPQLLAGSIQGSQWLTSLGNVGNLPMTLVFDRQGQLRAKKLGLISEEELINTISTLL